MLRFIIKIPGHWAPKAGFCDTIEAEFYDAAGALIVEKIKSVLGTQGLYNLSKSYALMKPTLPGYRRIPGKAADQPLILTGEMYDALQVRIDSGTLIVEVDDTKAHDPKTGDDYAADWQNKTAFMEKGFALAEPLLPALLEKIIVKNMAWAFI